MANMFIEDNYENWLWYRFVTNGGIRKFLRLNCQEFIQYVNANLPLYINFIAQKKLKNDKN